MKAKYSTLPVARKHEWHAETVRGLLLERKIHIADDKMPQLKDWWTKEHKNKNKREKRGEAKREGGGVAPETKKRKAAVCKKPKKPKRAKIAQQARHPSFLHVHPRGALARPLDHHNASSLPRRSPGRLPGPFSRIPATSASILLAPGEYPLRVLHQQISSQQTAARCTRLCTSTYI